tara:strand:- start:400 stop:549 length:150 start_codon:yes stop_codon:yes gene_type:complete
MDPPENRYWGIADQPALINIALLPLRPQANELKTDDKNNNLTFQPLEAP